MRLPNSEQHCLSWLVATTVQANTSFPRPLEVTDVAPSSDLPLSGKEHKQKLSSTGCRVLAAGGANHLRLLTDEQSNTGGHHAASPFWWYVTLFCGWDWKQRNAIAERRLTFGNMFGLLLCRVSHTGRAAVSHPLVESKSNQMVAQISASPFVFYQKIVINVFRRP